MKTDVIDAFKVLHLLYDFLVIVPEEVKAHETMCTFFLDIFESLGVPLSSKKTEGPCHVIEYLGIFLDSIKTEARLPRDKIVRIQQIINAIAGYLTCCGSTTG